MARQCAQRHLLLRSDKGNTHEFQCSALTQIHFCPESRDAVGWPRGVGESWHVHLRGVLRRGSAMRHRTQKRCRGSHGDHYLVSSPLPGMSIT